jgi:hypothetical protein
MRLKMAGFLKAFKEFFSAPAISSPGNLIDCKVRCAKCSEEITVKIRTTSDLSRMYEEDGGPSGSVYYMRKEILGSKCNNIMYAIIYFDGTLKVLSRDITGGSFID